MTNPPADHVFEALKRTFTPRSVGLVDIRRAGDEAVLMFRWPPHPNLFGVPVSLTRTDQRLDWDRPAASLDEWLESVDLWLMEDVENWFLWRARRRLVDDYIELRGPAWPSDERFITDVVDPNDPHAWLRTDFIAEDGFEPQHAIQARDAGKLIAWITAYENNSTGSPYVGQATVVREAPTVARLVHIELIDHGPATLLLDVIRAATHAAAEAGIAMVVTGLELEHLEVAGFRRTPDGQMAADTGFLDEDPEAADDLLRQTLTTPGRWGHNRDQAGRYLPTTRFGRLLHLLRYGPSGTRPKTYAG